MRKLRLVRLLQNRLVNPLVRTLLHTTGLPGYALLETTGRRSGAARRTPVGDGLAADGRTFWLIAEHGRRSGYVLNARADPRVRVRRGRRWRTGTAHVLPADDPIACQASMPKANARAVRLFGTELLTVRIDLDP